MKKDTKIYTVFFTFILTFVFVFILSTVNEFTKEKISENQSLFLKRAVLNSVGITYRNNMEIIDIYSKEISVKTFSGKEIYIAEKENKKIYAIIFSGNGLWSSITGILAVDPAEGRLSGFDIIEQNETPGLGGRIDEKEFKDQFSNEKIINGMIRFVKGEGDFNKDNGTVDSISGASSTSKSLEKIFNNALNELLGILKDSGVIQ